MTHSILQTASVALWALLLSSAVSAHDIIPKPQTFTPGKGCFPLGTAPVKVVDEMGCRHRRAISQCSDNARNVIVYKKIANAKSPEAYMLHITTDSLVIGMASDKAFACAWATIDQLTTGRGVASCDVADWPAYRWRSLMIDVSRHFQPVSFLKKQIDIMAKYKFNRLHLHLTDAAGWRIEIKRYPLLTRLAAWRPQPTWKEWNANGGRYVEEGTGGAYGGYYTQDELRDLVRYAAQHGIDVVPEIEMPGHSAEVLTAYPELSCTHKPYTQMDFCPGSIATYDFLENVLSEVMGIFPSRYIHVGGDEAGKDSWNDCPLCRRKMQELGCGPDGLQNDLISHIGKFLERHGRSLVGWDEVTGSSLGSDALIMVWRGLDKAAEAIGAGHKVVLSPGAYCYLDAYQDAPPSQPEAIGGYLPLEKVYGYVPDNDIPGDMIEGIQGNLWTEYVPTASHAEYMLYPRALAIAEIGWNGTAAKDYADFHRRATAQCRHLRRLGVNAFDLEHEAGERKESLRAVTHKARGCHVVYNSPYSTKYAAAGGLTLTDGIRGGWSYGDNKWQGFTGNGYCLDVTIDLGSQQKIASVSAGFMQSVGAWVFFPEEFIVSVSNDGNTFDKVYATTTGTDGVMQTGYRTLTWHGNRRTRYVRVQGKTTKDGGWLFTDEIIIR